MPRKVEVEERPRKHKGKGWVVLVLGLLVLINTYWSILSWPFFIGALLVIAGIIKLLVPKCC